MEDELWLQTIAAIAIGCCRQAFGWEEQIDGIAGLAAGVDFCGIVCSFLFVMAGTLQE